MVSLSHFERFDMRSLAASGLRSVASKSETKFGSASNVARAGPTPQNGSAILNGRSSSSRNSLAKARVSSLSVCNLVEKYALVGSHRSLAHFLSLQPR